jgi:hypothetical protein
MEFFFLDFPLASENGEEWTLGAVMESKIMINISNFGHSYRNDNLNRTIFSDAEGLICYDGLF